MNTFFSTHGGAEWVGMCFPSSLAKYSEPTWVRASLKIQFARFGWAVYGKTVSRPSTHCNLRSRWATTCAQLWKHIGIIRDNINMSDTFNISGYGQNLAATITAAIIFGVAWIVRNKCKHSRCAIDSKCLTCSADDLDTIRETPRPRSWVRRPSVERRPPIRRVESRDEGEIV